MVISIATRIGVAKTQTQYQNFLNTLMCSPYSCGILGGEGDKAYYTIGLNTAKKRYYYLDPHYIQRACDPGKISLKSYLQKTINEFSFKDMNPCLQASFLVRNNKELEDFITSLDSAIQHYSALPGEDAFFSIMESDNFDFGDKEGDIMEF